MKHAAILQHAFSRNGYLANESYLAFLPFRLNVMFPLDVTLNVMMGLGLLLGAVYVSSVAGRDESLSHIVIDISVLLL